MIRVPLRVGARVQLTVGADCNPLFHAGLKPGTRPTGTIVRCATGVAVGNDLFGDDHTYLVRYSWTLQMEDEDGVPRRIAEGLYTADEIEVLAPTLTPGGSYLSYLTDEEIGRLRERHSQRRMKDWGPGDTYEVCAACDQQLCDTLRLLDYLDALKQTAL